MQEQDLSPDAEFIAAAILVIVSLTIVGSCVLCCCGSCIAYNLRAIDSLLKKPEQQPCAKCSSPAAASARKGKTENWLTIIGLLTGYLLMSVYYSYGDEVFPVPWTLFNAFAGVIVGGLYLRKVPTLVLRQLEKPHSERYMGIARAIANEDARRRNNPHDAAFDNTGIDRITQAVLATLALFAGALGGVQLVALPVSLDLMCGSTGLKRALKAYVKFYYKNDGSDQLPHASTVDKIRQFTEAARPVAVKAEPESTTKPVKAEPACEVSTEELVNADTPASPNLPVPPLVPIEK